MLGLQQYIKAPNYKHYAWIPHQNITVPNHESEVSQSLGLRQPNTRAYAHPKSKVRGQTESHYWISVYVVFQTIWLWFIRTQVCPVSVCISALQFSAIRSLRTCLAVDSIVSHAATLFAYVFDGHIIETACVVWLVNTSPRGVFCRQCSQLSASITSHPQTLPPTPHPCTLIHSQLGRGR